MENVISNLTDINADISNRVNFLVDLLHCNGRMFVSCYNHSGSLLETNYTNMIFDTIFRSTEHLKQAIAHGEESRYPLIITTTIGMMWAIVYEKAENGQLLHLYTIGPVFTTSLSDEDLEIIRKNRNIREKWKEKLIGYLHSVPIISASEFFKYTLMLHFAVTEEHLKPSDLVFSTLSKQAPLFENERPFNFSEYWSKENAMLEMIRQGDIYYKAKLPSASNILQTIDMHSDRNYQDLKLYAISFATLCIRASIDGGISPDTAYMRGNIYLKNLAQSTTYAEMLSITHDVFEDFVFLVHNHKEQPKYSDAITACTDYIETHPDEPLSIDYLAERLGYTKYYLSKKFHAEVGMTINDYIKKSRIDKACYLLVTTKMSIQDISDQLHFGNRNFFTKVFKEITGTNPASFRNNHIRN